ncbi:semaphorin-4A [Astyanax mexicanus]|uniref:semaphorin-4A n=1 Tax=Astyanax mexicanus TaxID=7994 RepID=UPI0020CB0CA3|nr:semaphorin-4A [Astyanax mexicanus]
MLVAHSLLRSMPTMAGGYRSWKFCFLLLGLLHFTQSSISPRTTFLPGNPGRVLSLYDVSDALNTTVLLLSPDATTLFAGARNAVLSLDVSQPDVITLKRKHDWAPKDARDRCGTDQLKNCANFIRVLQFINSTHLYTCGSFALKPHDIILTADTLSVSRITQSAKGRCPYKGSERNTAVFVDGELYTATTNDYSGNEPIISRHFSKEPKNDLSLEKLQNILNEPTFISSFYTPSEGKVFLFFREDEAEYNFMQRFTVSRVAQVCIDDNGGQRVLQKRWTTFAKSQLVCQREKQLPFNLLQDVVMVPPPEGESPDKTLFYGIFTSQWLSGQSAVCAFTLRDIKAVFSGDYKTYSSKTNQWTVTPNTDAKLGKCGLHNGSDDLLNLAKKNFLTAKPVKSVDQKQLLTATEQLYSRITAQRVQAANGHTYTVLYLLTGTGFLQKAVLLKDRAHIIEEIQVFKQPQILTSILLSATKGMVFVGFSEGVIRVPVSNCSFYSSCAECVLARDPFCSWDSQGKGCVPVSNMYSSLHQDVENGSVKEQCEDLEHQNGTPVPKVVRAHLNRLVKLPCHSSSRLAKVSWRFANHSTVPQTRFLQHGDGSLVFRATPSNALEFQCVTEEQGFQKIEAIFSLKVQASPHSYITAQQHGVELELMPQPLLDKDTPQKTYYNEMVALSFLFVVALCVIAVGAVLWRKKSQNKPVTEYATNEDFSIERSVTTP